MSPVYAIVGFIVVERLAELAFAARNARRMLARGAVESGARHYPLFILLHAAWLVALVLTVPADTAVNLPLLAVFAALQGVRLWVITSLGERWTTRVIVPSGEPPVTKGPYRYMKHPNYAVVVAEIAVVPLMFGAWATAALFSLLNLALLRHRIRVEEAALAASRRG